MLAVNPVTLIGAARFRHRSPNIAAVMRATVITTPSENTSNSGAKAPETIFAVAPANDDAVDLRQCSIYCV